MVMSNHWLDSHHKMCLNPSKCTFDIGADKFLGFILTTQGIMTNHDKCVLILDMRSLQNLMEV